MLEWLKKQAVKMLLRLARKQAAEIAVSLLAQVDPSKLADAVRPHVRRLFEITGPDWQTAFATAWRKTDTFVEELLQDPNVGI
jgi:hypothetical protein